MKKKVSDDSHSKQYSWNRNNMQTDIHIYIFKKKELIVYLTIRYEPEFSTSR